MEESPRYEAAPTNRYRIDALYEGGQILKLLGNSREPLGSEEIAQRMDLTPNRAFRMCATLEELGFIQEAGGKYRPGMGLALIWARVRAEREETHQTAQQDLDKLDNIITT